MFEVWRILFNCYVTCKVTKRSLTQVLTNTGYTGNWILDIASKLRLKPENYSRLTEPQVLGPFSIKHAHKRKCSEDKLPAFRNIWLWAFTYLVLCHQTIYKAKLRQVISCLFHFVIHLKYKHLHSAKKKKKK